MTQYIEKEVLSERGAALRFHFVTNIRAVRSLDGVENHLATVASWGTLASMLSQTPLTTRVVRLEDIDLVEGSFADITAALVLVEDDPLFGGVVVPLEMATETLEEARRLAWERVKTWRARDIASDMVTPYGSFQCDSESRTSL